MKQGLCIMSRASLKFPFCSAFVPWLHGHCLITEFWKAVILICNTFLQYAWFCNWDASNGFFETLARLIPIFTDGLICEEFPTFLCHDGPYNLAGKPIRQTMWSHKRRPGMHEVERSPEVKVVSSQCCYSICHYCGY